MKNTLFVLVFALLLAPLGAQAQLSSTVRIRIRNSANYIYPCNAGIGLNPRSVGKGVDYVRGAWVASENNPRAGSGDGTAVAGSPNTTNADPDQALLASLFSNSSRLYPAFNQLLPESIMYDYVLGKAPGFDINLASDTYDSSYFVTFCFVPSMIDFKSDGVPLTMRFVSARATHSVVPGSTYNYATDSGLRAMLEIKCFKDAEHVVQHYTPAGITSMDALLTPFAGNTTVELVPSGGILVNDPSSLVAGSLMGNGEVPDRCRARIYFMETSGKIRPHVLTASDIQIDLNATIVPAGG